MNNEWKVVNIFWYNEDETNKVPEEYLPVITFLIFFLILDII